MAAARGHARRRRQLPWLAWLGGLAALAVSGWIVWRSLHGVVPPAAPSTATTSAAHEASSKIVGEAEPPEITQEERHKLDDILRTKRAERRQSFGQ